MTSFFNSSGPRRALLLISLLAGLHVARGYAQDESAVDTTSVATDTLKSPLIPTLGALGPHADTAGFDYRTFVWSDVRSLGEAFKYRPGVFLRDFGGPGYAEQITIDGVDGRGLAFMLNGRPIGNPVTGAVNPYEIPIEAVDHLDVRRFASFSASTGGTSGLINIRTRQFSTNRPITKIRFIQGPYEHLLTDAFYTQNVFRDFNVQFGVQRQARDDRFVNSAYDSWIIRSAIRYNVSGRLNISLSDLYRRWTVGMNNGIDVDSTRARGLNPFSDAEAIVLSASASERRTQRDVTLSAVALLLPDTTISTQMHGYFTTAEREYTDPAGLASSTFDRYAYEVQGLILHQIIEAGQLSGFAGVHIEHRIAGLGPAGVHTNTMSAWYADVTYEVAGFLRPGAAVRGERNDASTHVSWGVRTSLVATPGLVLSAEYSRIGRHPTLQERNWNLYRFHGPPNLLEQHERISLSLELQGGPAHLEVAASERRTENALIFRTLSPTAQVPPVVLDVLPDVHTRQIRGNLNILLWRFELKGGLTWTEMTGGGGGISLHPKFVLTGEIAYRDTLFDGALDARFGLQSRFASRHTGVRYFPSHDLYAENSGRLLRTFSSLDLFGVFRIGDAFVTLAWENPLDREYMTVYPYPAMGRNIRIGVNWIFLD